MTVTHTVGFRLTCVALAVLISLSAAIGQTRYTVQQGDTLSELAQRFHISADVLSQRNNLASPEALTAGQTLIVPEGAASVPSRNLTGRELQQERTRLLARQRSARGQRIVSAARAYLGTRYRRGGLSSRGIDCSGLVVRAMAAQGRAVPHQSGALYRMGEKVTYAQLQPGDLLFFNTNGRGISHVGIWVGDNRFVHAASRGVRIDAVAGYYARRLVGARRIH